MVNAPIRETEQLRVHFEKLKNCSDWNQSPVLIQGLKSEDGGQIAEFPPSLFPRSCPKMGKDKSKACMGVFRS